MVDERVRTKPDSRTKEEKLLWTIFSSSTTDGEKAAAVEIVGAAINLAKAVSLKHIADADKFTAGLSQIIDGVVDCLNASMWAKPRIKP